MWFKREISEKIQTHFRSRPALILTGARQTGKTSLLRHLFPQLPAVSFDLPRIADEAEKTPEAFLDRIGSPVILDEIQYVPSLFRYLKARIDEDRERYGRYLITGSQKFSLMKGVTESLAGRISVHELLPLSLPEITESLPQLGWKEFFLRGGLPELYRNPEIGRRAFYEDYLRTYLERDLPALLHVQNLRDFDRFIRACALRCGQLLNKADLARDVGVSPTTIQEWISVLEASNQIRLLEPWFSNGSRSITKSPKLYFIDHGLLLSLLDIETEADLRRSPMVGALWENFVFSELHKALELRSSAKNLFFFRDRSKEIDFIVHKGGAFSLFEAKWTERPSARDLTAFEWFRKDFARGRVRAETVVCTTPEPFPVSERIEAIPIDRIRDRLEDE